MKKMNLLRDILDGVREIERRERKKNVKHSEENLETTQLANKKSTIKITRDPLPSMLSTSGKNIDNAFQQWGVSSKSIEFDPNTIVFYGINKDTPTHMAKLKDLQTLSIYDPSLADKILTLS